MQQLFSLYIIYKKINFNNGRIGAAVQGQEIKTLRFADNIVILSKFWEDLEDKLNSKDFALKEKYRICINKNKTMVMECSWTKIGEVK